MKLHRLPDLIGENGVFNDGDWVESKDQDPNGDVRLIQLADIGDGEYLDKSERFLTSQKAVELKCTFLEPGDILVARMPDPLGRACIFPGDSKPCVTVVDVCIVRPDPNIADRRWLLHKINSPEFRHLINTFATGTTRQRISRKNLGKLQFPLPELGEQRRITAVLDKADALRQKRRAALAKLDTLLQATFLHMFGDPVTNPMGWEKRPLGEIVEVQTGSTPSRKNAANYGGTIPWVKTTEVDWGIISSTEETVTELGLKNARLKLYPKGSVLIAMYGQGITRGKSAILGIEATVNQACAVLLPSELLITEYLSALLKISYEELRNLGRGGNQPNLNLSLVRSFEIPVPKIQEQIKFAEFQRKIQMQVKHFETAVNNLDNLFHALQQRAFSGQL